MMLNPSCPAELLLRSGVVTDVSTSWIWNVFFSTSQVLNASQIFFLAFVLPGNIVYFLSFQLDTKTHFLFPNYLFSQTCQMTSLKMARQPLRSGLFLSLLATCLMKTTYPLPAHRGPLLLTSAPAPISPPPPPSAELSSLPPRAQARTAAAVTPAETLSLSLRTGRPRERQQWWRTRPSPGRLPKFAEKPPTLGAIVSL